MGKTIIEKILATHSTYNDIKPGEIIDVSFDVRVSRDTGGANIIKNIQEHNLSIDNPEKTFFTFDSNFPRSDRHAEGIHRCRVFARANNIRIFDFETGIGTHLMIDQGLAVPGSILVSNDPQVNVLGAIGALGLNMGDKDIAAAFAKGKLWYRVPKTIKINLKGKLPSGLTAKDLAMNLFEIFGSNKLIGKIVELTGEVIDHLSLDSRISLASMANEFNAVTFLLIPNREVLDYCQVKSNTNVAPIFPDNDAEYEDIVNLDIRKFSRKIVKVGIPPEIIEMNKLFKTGIETAFLGTSSNGRIEDLRIVAGILKGRKIASGIVFRITPATDQIWTQSLQEGLIDIFKESGAIVTNAGGGDGIYESGVENYGEVAISSGTPAYPGIVIRGDLYLSSPAIVAASAVAGYITTPDKIPVQPETIFSFTTKEAQALEPAVLHQIISSRPTILRGKVWNIPYDNIDTDMIYNRRYEEYNEVGKIAAYTFSNLSGFEDFSSKALAGDIVVTGRNFGLGSSRQQAVDCFKILGIQAIVAKSFSIIYERNAINAGLPIIVCSTIDNLQLQTGDELFINLLTGELKNERTNISAFGEKFSNIQMEIYQQGGLFTD